MAIAVYGLIQKVLQYCNKIAESEGIKFKRTYSREIKNLKFNLRFTRNPRNIKKHKRLQGRLYRITVKLFNELVEQLTEETTAPYYDTLNVLYRVLTQQRNDTNKVYSIHEPTVHCIAKGKDHKPYEFGNKSSFAYTRDGGIIVGAIAFEDNPFDGHTLEPQLEQVKELTGFMPKVAIVDKGYRGQNQIGATQVVSPKNLKRESYYKKKKREARCRSRAGVEGLISHLKHDHRMLRNYLSGTLGDKINTLLAASAYNMKKWMRLKREETIFYLFRFYLQSHLFALINIQATEASKKRYY